MMSDGRNRRFVIALPLLGILRTPRIKDALNTRESAVILIDFIVPKSATIISRMGALVIGGTGITGSQSGGLRRRPLERSEHAGHRKGILGEKGPNKMTVQRVPGQQAFGRDGTVLAKVGCRRRGKSVRD